jgi:hypothetical protein
MPSPSPELEETIVPERESWLSLATWAVLGAGIALTVESWGDAAAVAVCYFGVGLELTRGLIRSAR